LNNNVQRIGQPRLADLAALLQSLPLFMTVAEAAEALGVTQSCIRRWILERRIATVKIGRLVRIPASEIQRIIESGLRPAREACP
jgi:excisionase family DNA binding protein